MWSGLLALLLLGSLGASPSAADGKTGPATNAEMTAIFDADQKARQGPDIDWAVIAPQDAERRKRTQALLDAGALASGDDFFHAAFVFQHGASPDDYLKAHLLATLAAARGSARATWIAAATLDRYLQETGKPQVLGTQFRTGPDGRTTQEPFDRTLASDALRTALGVPVLAAQEEQRKAYERAARPSPASVSKPARQYLAKTAPAKTFTAKLQHAACNPIAGSDTLLDRPDLRWIVVGEVHGTNETPKAFADLVCLASMSRPVNVAVEQTTIEQPAIDDFIGSDGGAVATSRFLASGIWAQDVKDGRSSEAYFALFQRLRALRAAGRITSVVAFQPVYTPGSAGFDIADYEKALASSLVGRVPRDGRVLVLVGNLHARRTAPPWAKAPYVPMAGYLPAETSVTLDARWNGGSYWACGAEMRCGPQIASPAATNGVRGITRDAAGGPYWGALNLGTDVTASPPRTPSATLQVP
jgi:hypothetical protein